MQPSGNINWIDEYGTIYETVWETIGNVIDITTITKTPYVWGEADSGFVSDNVVYRRGIVSIVRQVLRPEVDGYTIVAEGGSSYIDIFPTTFPCTKIKTNFKYYLDDIISDTVDMLVSDGNGWTDVSDDEDIVDINALFEWIDVW